MSEKTFEVELNGTQDLVCFLVEDGVYLLSNLR